MNTATAEDWFNALVCIGSLGILALVVALVSLLTLFNCSIPSVTRRFLNVSKLLTGGFAIFYASYCAWQLYENVAIRKGIEAHFRPTLVFISIFWVMVPPVWFFTEYFLLDSGVVPDLKDEDRARAKTYADYASKVWAGVVTVLAGLIALNQR